MVRLFLVFSDISQKDVAKIPIVLGVPHNVNLERATTWLVGLSIYFTFLNNNSLTPRQFLREKMLWKKKAIGEMLIEQIIKFELRGPGP